MFLVPGQYDHLPPLSSTPEEIILESAERHGVDQELALAVAEAESGLDPEAKNPSSSASGLYQFLDSTFHTYCLELYRLTDKMEDKNSPRIQIECAMSMIANGGISHWNASKHIWMMKK